MIANKVLTREQLRQQVAAWRQAGDSITLANGAFDLLHVGHVRYLRAAKQLGGRLIVGINSDVSVRSLKGEGRPLVPGRSLPASARVVELRDGSPACPPLR